MGAFNLPSIWFLRIRVSVGFCPRSPSKRYPSWHGWQLPTWYMCLLIRWCQATVFFFFGWFVTTNAFGWLKNESFSFIGVFSEVIRNLITWIKANGFSVISLPGDWGWSGSSISGLWHTGGAISRAPGVRYIAKKYWIKYLVKPPKRVGYIILVIYFAYQQKYVFSIFRDLLAK